MKSKLITIAGTLAAGALFAVGAYYLLPASSTDVAGLTGIVFLSFYLGKFVFNLFHDK